MKKLYNKARNDQWELSDVCMTVTARYGTGGGNVPIVIDTLVFDKVQITSRQNGNHPTWGGIATPFQRGTQKGPL